MNKTKFLPCASVFFFVFLSCLYIYHSMHAFSAQKHEWPEMQAHLNNQWYIQDPDVLKKHINTELQKAFKQCVEDFDIDDIFALILPHAGHSYSGFCAATGYSLLQKKKNLKRVVVLAPSHYVSVDGIALFPCRAYKTCLGSVAFDVDAIADLATSQYCNYHEEAYLQEHAFEIQLPFLQIIQPDIRIIPLIVGRLTTEMIEDLVPRLQKLHDDETVFIISTDFVHYGSRFQYVPFSSRIHQKVAQVDSKVLEAIASGSLSIFQDVVLQTKATVCGQNPLKLLVSLCEAKKGGFGTHQLSYYVSGSAVKIRITNEDVLKSMMLELDDETMQHSVSYASVVCTSQKSMDIQRPTPYEAAALCALARYKIATALGESVAMPIFPLSIPFFQQTRGAFVTLHTKSGDLRGCIGNITSSRALYQTVSNMAVAAALHDRRFEKVRSDELDDIVIEISVLSDPQKIADVDEIILGKHGVILHWKDPYSEVERSAVFLPDVAIGQGWSKQEMLENLSQKAGCASDAWKGSTFEVFYTIKMSE